MKITPPKSLVLLATLALVVCSGRREQAGGGLDGAATPGPAVDPGLSVVTIAGEPVPYRSFERYLADNAGDEPEEGEQQDMIKSRLLDQFIEEQLLLRTSGRFKITVSDAEVDAYLEQIGVAEGEADAAGGEGKEAFREKVRHGLILQKVKDEAVLSKVQVTPGEVEDAIRKQPELLQTSRQVVLRQILVDDKSLADRLRETLRDAPAKFEALAREHSVAPDRGQARAYGEENLPVELREAIFALEPGDVSPVQELAQRFLLFQLVRKIENQPADRDEVRRRLRLELFQAKGEQALDRFLADLKKETEIRVNRSILPFNYTGEHRG